MSSPLVIMAVVFGGAAGAFVPRVAHRLAVAHGEQPRSACAGCGRRFAGGLAGWVRAGGACAGCVPGRHGESTVLASAIVTGSLAVSLGTASQLPLLLVAAVLGVLLAVIDLRCHRLPDTVVALFTLVAGLPLALLDPARLPVAVAAAALAGAAYLALALLPGGGLGLGDVKLGAALAFVLGFGGWPAVVAGLGAAHLISGLVAAALLITRRADRKRALPFGPALLAGALIALLTV
ncbi:prepilin peptidase [Actinoplanes sp. DH11]|uniref:prepilin peptidase n=1 Tax=Actinoplanes sp. DH11 TaxID=2857011 RepID=UPI001E3F5EFA|nr:prepilin peptidase [Actinoplanes sp. DH11]